MNATTRSAKSSAAALLVLVCSAGFHLALAQQASFPAPKPPTESAGEMEVAARGYVLTSSGQNINTTGVSFDFTEFHPRFGLIHAKLDAYDSQSSFQTGDAFVELSGMALLNRHWSFLGGDFRTTADMVGNPFVNIYTPDIAARGLRIQVKEENRTVMFFGGETSVLQGPRLPFRILLPQHTAGAQVQQKLGKFQLGARVMTIWTNLGRSTAVPLVAADHAYDTTQIASLQSLFTANKHLKVYSEGSFSHAAARPGEPQPKPFSYFAGPVWESRFVTVRANYVRQGGAYLPLLGYVAGDRKGPFGEAIVHPAKWIEFHASGSRYRNNVDENPLQPTFTSPTWSAGAGALLPLRFAVSADYSFGKFRATGPVEPGTYPVENRQLNLSVSRPVRRHTLRASLSELQLQSPASAERQRFVEVEDTFAVGRMTFAGSVRPQRLEGANPKTTLFYRASATLNLPRISLYAHMQWGNDVASKTLFAMTSYNSTVFGASARLARTWQLDAEVFRNNLTTGLNPASIFALQNNGAAIPTTLAGFNQWSVYFNLSRRFRWGSALRRDGHGGFVPQATLYGSVRGFVKAASAFGTNAAAGIPVALDRAMVVVTDADGIFEFANVPEGFHEVGLAVDELPADLNPEQQTSAVVKVTPKGIARADFLVSPLASISGHIDAPKGVSLETVVVRLLPGARYTTPDADGNFGFFNVPLGGYDVTVDGATLPAETALQSPASQHVTLEHGGSAAAVQFIVIESKTIKPVRIVSEEQVQAPPPPRQKER